VDDKAPDVFVIGLDPKDRIFDSEDINRQLAVLDQADTNLVDSMTRPMFGPLTLGRVVEINGVKMKIGGNYVLGTGFMGLGVILVSGKNFVRLFPYRQLGQVNLGLIQLKPEVDPKDGAASLRRLLGSDIQIFTRPELQAHETAYWTTRTSVGVLFGSGLMISFIVGVMVVYQILATQVSRQLPQFATLKAVGYDDRFLSGTVIAMALLIVVTAFFPALAASLGVYAVVRDETLLPVEMSGARIGIVLVATLAMAAASALLSMRSLRRAEPADLFG
jgi:putative ABC transport system permease protein